jgi:zeaxanthin glucosyltransferase
MANIGCFSHPGVAHVSPPLALAHRLQRRGHNITFFHLADPKSRIDAAGIRHVSIGEDERPAGSLAREIGGPAEIQRFEIYSAIPFTGIPRCD